MDNGQPFAHTGERKLPTPLVLWLVSLGIEVHFNRVRCPQQNGSVECTQRISKYWANPENCQNTEQLQKALDQVSFEHIHVLRQRSKQDQTRIEQYPMLKQTGRPYKQNQVDPQKAKDYLAQFEWTRKIYKNGYISIFGLKFSVSAKFGEQTAYIRFDPANADLVVSITNGKIIKRMKEIDLSKKAIQNLNIFPDNFTT